MRRSALLTGSALLAAACGDDSGPPDSRGTDPAPPGGTITVTWTIVDDADEPLSCAEVGASLVSVSMRRDSDVFGRTETMPCGPGAGTTAPIDPGTYEVQVRLAGVTADPVEVRDVAVESQRDTPVAVSLTVIPRGGFTFRIVAGTGQGNCTPPAQGGAGITEMELALARQEGGCVPVTFAIAAGASQPAATYTTDCADPAPTACIATDQQVTVAPQLPSGGYRMTILGWVGDAACWSRIAQFQVPAGGQTASLPPQTLSLDPRVPGCEP
jgi:hypothetical protein